MEMYAIYSAVRPCASFLQAGVRRRTSQKAAQSDEISNSIPLLAKLTGNFFKNLR